MKRRYFYIVILSVFVMTHSCKKDEEPFNFKVADYYKEMETLSIEVAYETNAAPYTENASGGNAWQLTEDNIELLFANRPTPVDVIVPNGLAAMQEIPNQQKNMYTGEEILALADQYRQGVSTRKSANFFILILDGYFEQDGQQQKGVLGVQFSNSQVAAIFKPVVESSNSFIGVKTLVEQTTIIHELGHGLGLVKNGVPLTTPHHDTDHTAHCTNEDCVMYWLNEGTSGVLGFIQEFFQNGTVLVFGPECVADTEAYMP